MRYVNPTGSTIEVEQRGKGDSVVVFRGLAARTEHDYRPWVGSDVTERIAAGAFTSVNTDEVVMLLDHSGLPLASTKAGTLKLDVTERGLEYRAEVPSADPDASRLQAKIRSGAVWGSSIGFVTRDVEYSEGNRLIKDVELFDVSAVGVPANPATSAVVERSVQALLKKIEARTHDKDDLRDLVQVMVSDALDERGVQDEANSDADADAVDLLKLRLKRLIVT